MKPKLFINVLFLVALLSSQTAYSQTKRQIVVTKGDTVIQVGITYKSLSNLSDSKEYYWYSEPTIHHNQGNYSGYLLDGEYELFGPNFEMLEKGNFKNGLKTGTWFQWDCNGKLILRMNYKKGVKHGSVKELNSETGEYEYSHYCHGKIKS